MKRTSISATGKERFYSYPQRPAVVPSPVASAFTLVELLSVTAIMAIVTGLLVMSMQQVRGPTVQVAAGQVASGLALARQLAIAKGTEARFVVASSTNGPGFPAEPYRYWTIITSNRGGTGVWVMEREWEALPLGTVVLNLSASNYAGVNWPNIPTNQVGVAYSPKYDGSSSDLASAWEKFQSYTTNTLNIAYPDRPTNMQATWPVNLPYLGFSSSGGLRLSGMGGRLFDAGAGGSRMAALRLVEGRSDPQTAEIIIERPDNARFVEVHDMTGRILVRKREDYSR